MNIYILLTVLILSLFSCVSPKKADIPACINLSGLNNNIYEELIAYQTANPIPELKKFDSSLPPPPETAFRYIYEVWIKKESDTIIIFSLKHDGIRPLDINTKNKILGVYEDSCLKPTYLIGDSLIAGKLITDYKNKKLNNFNYDNSSIVDKFLTTSTYVLKNNVLVKQGNLLKK